MSKVIFNNKNYSIDDSAFVPHSNALKQHFSSVMNGSGAAINFGGTVYNIDSAKLAAAKNALITHLGTISGNDYKVVIGEVEYGIDAGKVAGAVSEIEAVLGGAISGDGEGGSFPISWNTMEVVNNTGIYFEGETIPNYVKVSDYIPTEVEMLNAKTCFYDICMFLTERETYADNKCVLYIYSTSDGGNAAFEFLSVATAGVYDGMEVTEAGLYVLNIGGMYNEDIDFVIDFAEPIFTLQDWGGMFKDYGSYIKDFEYERGMTWGEWIEKYDPNNQVLKLNTEMVNENGSPAVCCVCNPILGDSYPANVRVDATNKRVCAEDIICPVLYTVEHK